MANEPRGLCHNCKTYHDVVGVTDKEAVVIQEDATCMADYYKMVEHDKQDGSGRCDGSGNPPESLTEDDDPIFDNMAGEFDKQPDESAYDGLLPGDEMPNRSGDGPEEEIYGRRIHD